LPTLVVTSSYQHLQSSPAIYRPYTGFILFCVQVLKCFSMAFVVALSHLKIFYHSWLCLGFNYALLASENTSHALFVYVPIFLLPLRCELSLFFIFSMGYIYLYLQKQIKLARPNKTLCKWLWATHFAWQVFLNMCKESCKKKLYSKWTSSPTLSQRKKRYLPISQGGQQKCTIVQSDRAAETIQKSITLGEWLRSITLLPIIVISIGKVYFYFQNLN